MVIDVRQVPEGLSQIERGSALEAFAAELPPLVRPVECRADLDRMGDVITARLRYDALLTMRCARCLESYTAAVGGDVMFFIKHEKERIPNIGDDDDGLDFYFDDRHESVDVSPAIYDDIMISLPLKPLCAEACAGVAYNSGGETISDPRWDALKKLR